MKKKHLKTQLRKKKHKGAGKFLLTGYSRENPQLESDMRKKSWKGSTSSIEYQLKKGDRGVSEKTSAETTT